MSDRNISALNAEPALGGPAAIEVASMSRRPSAWLCRLSLAELLCAALLAVSALCVAGPNLGGQAQAATSQGQAIVNAAASMAGKPYCFDGGNTSGPTHGDGGSGCVAASIKGFAWRAGDTPAFWIATPC